MAKNKKQQSKKQMVAAHAAEQTGSKFSLDQFKKFLTDVQREFTKIAWPTKQNTIRLTITMIIFVFIVSLYLGAVDMILGKLIGYILSL
ncbi:MAG: preprotein translocase subunit SecE [Desulfobulbaceae bacterium]|jgi:preprotein translocase subunit SecE|nr:preprotein translocase subunit SecE [Desulfobulbaceae bacterium]